jgi:hypothetical protein
MSLSVKALLGVKDTPNITGPVVSIPLAVRFTVTDCDWEVLSGGKLYHVRSATDGPIRTAVGDLDAWAVRSDFLRVESEDDMLQFLNRTGVFDRDQEHWIVSDLFQFQQVIAYLLKTPPARWKALKSIFKTQEIIEAVATYQTPRIGFVWTEASHAAVIRTNTTLGALLATLQVDHIRGAKFAFCARANCRRQFEIESEHPRKYCSAECAHIEAVRQYRERMKVKRK